MPRKQPALGPLQLKIMQVLWKVGSADVTRVREELRGESLAYTTVATMLRKMEERGLVRHSEEGRRFIYAPAVGEAEITRSMSNDLIDRLFEGSLAETVKHLLHSRDVSAEELDELEAMIRQRKKQK